MIDLVEPTFKQTLLDESEQRNDAWACNVQIRLEVMQLNCLQQKGSIMTGVITYSGKSLLILYHMNLFLPTMS